MNLRKLAPISIAAGLALALVAGLTGSAAAGNRQTCHMKGIWNGVTSDVFEFDAAYVRNGGEDDFTGIYRNPGVSEANISAAARAGTWNILLSYVDPVHRGLSKKLVGTGMLDGTSHGIMITGTFREFLPGHSSPTTSGTFVIDGKCR